MASCVTELDLHPLRRDVSGRESGDGRGDVDDLPALRADGRHSRHRLRPGPRARGVAEPSRWPSRPRNHWRYAELLPLEPAAVRHDWPVGWTPIIDSPRLAQHLGVQQILLKDEGRNPTARSRTGPARSALPTRCKSARRRSPARRPATRPAAWPATRRWPGLPAIHFRAANGAGAEGRPAASVRRDGVRREVVVR